MMRSQTPALRHRTKRLEQVVGGPYSLGSARHGAPVRKTQKIPFRTRRSSTRGTPRGLFGSNGAITPHPKSVSSYPCMIKPSQTESLNHTSIPAGIPFLRVYDLTQDYFHEKGNDGAGQTKFHVKHRSNKGR